MVDGVGGSDLGQVWFAVMSLDDADGVAINPGGDELEVHTIIDGAPVEQTHPWDRNSMRWLRFRDNGGSVLVEASANNDDQFETVTSVTLPFDPTAARLVLGGGGWSGPPATVNHVVQVDNFIATVP